MIASPRRWSDGEFPTPALSGSGDEGLFSAIHALRLLQEAPLLPNYTEQRYENVRPSVFRTIALGILIFENTQVADIATLSYLSPLKSFQNGTARLVRMRAVAEAAALARCEYLREIMRDFILSHFQRAEAFDPGRIDKSRSGGKIGEVDHL